ncbi:MAG: hypothetical protein K6E38_01190 [Fretibacterium sp.]|nr:hypothetical protein [Fretibacterium sp.]
MGRRICPRPSGERLRNGISVTCVPCVRYLSADRERSAGTWKESPKTLNQVVGSLRQLSIVWSASDRARGAAEEAGIYLPSEGVTFFPPHIRGTAAGGEGELRKHIRIKGSRKADQDEVRVM